MTSIAIRLESLVGARLARELRRFAKFGVVGVSGFVIDFGLLYLLTFWAGLPPWLANACSFTVAVSNTFIWNRLWTFPESRQRPLGTQLAQFFAVNLIGLAINELTFLGSRDALWSHYLTLVWAQSMAKVTASVVALFWNFGVNRLWTWRGL
jgi:putative flippase GtrA